MMQGPPQREIDMLLAQLRHGRFAAVVAGAQALVRQFPQSALLWSILGSAGAQSNRMDLAAAAFGEANRLHPDQFQTLNNLGNVLQYQGKLVEAIACYRRVLVLRPGLAETTFNLGNALLATGQATEAIACLRQALAIKPDLVGALGSLGNALRDQGKAEEAIACYRRALAINPGLADVDFSLATVLQDQGRIDEAIAAYRRVLAARPDIAEVHYNLGHALQQQGRIEESLGCYRRALQLRPDLAEAHSNLANGLRELGQLDEAAAHYQHALTLDPGRAEALCSLGNVLQQLARLDAAIDCYTRALALNPGFAEAHTGLGDALRDQGRLDEALAGYRNALACKPDLAFAKAQMLHQQYHMCDWQGFAQLAADCAALGSQPQGVPPFCLLSLADDAALQLRLARIWADETCKHKAPAIAARPTARPQRLRIGYFSADFHDHATLFLMAGLLRAHDRARFEVCAYSYGRDPAGDLGERARRDVDRFIDIAGQPSRAVADLVHGHGLDIAIDLKGYTAHGRLDLFQYRLAPVQISYLGYPGPLGADFIDYIVADPVVIPDAARAFYNESVIRLPHSYQPNDNTRAIAATQTGRADFGLPEHGVVLCCFNNSYKITPREFDIWMRLLGRVEGSVLWLLKANRWCEDNLRREAAARGIAPERLVFAERVGQAEHLARHKHADLFVDTFNCNAHTTSSDALWAGLPVVTRAGQQFAARVSASLLTAVGLPDLITHSDADYEALIFALATDPARLAAIRARLSANRLTQPLFDTVQYTRHFEAGLERAYERYFAGLAPHDIQVAP